MWTRTKTLNSYIRGNANSSNSVRNLSYFSLSCEHNIETDDRVFYWISRNCTFHNQTIESVPLVEHLGTHLGDNLNFNLHNSATFVNHLRPKLNALVRLKICLSFNAKKDNQLHHFKF